MRIIARFWKEFHLNSFTQTAPSFTYDKSAKKFEGPLQKSQKEQDIAKANEEEEKKQVANKFLHMLV